MLHCVCLYVCVFWGNLIHIVISKKYLWRKEQRKQKYNHMQYDDANPSTSPEQAWDHDRYLRQHSFSFIYNINSIAQEKLDRNHHENTTYVTEIYQYPTELCLFFIQGKKLENMFRNIVYVHSRKGKLSNPKTFPLRFCKNLEMCFALVI